MEIKLLDNKKGFILTRQPEVVDNSLYITFTGAPENATAIFENGKDSLYKLLRENCCEVPKNFLVGEIKITIAILDGDIKSSKWECEGIKTSKISDGNILIAPNDMNIPEKIVDVQLEMQEIKDNIHTLMKNYSELETKLTKLLEGYDIT